MTKEQYDKWQTDTLKTYMEEYNPSVAAIEFWDSMKDIDSLEPRDIDGPVKVMWRLDVPTLPFVKISQE